jgi:Site-specific recombinase XerD
MSETSPTAISHHLNAWLLIKKESKSHHTFAASKSAAKAFLRAVGNIPLPTLTEAHYSIFLRALKSYHARTEQLYATLIFGWFVYLGAKEIMPINISKLKYARENEQRRPGKRLRDFDHAALEQLKQSILGVQVGESALAQARAKAMVILAMESGLRVSELCKLRVGDLDLDHLRGKVIGKRDKQRRFPFTQKSVRAIQVYLRMRQRLEPDRGKDLKPSEIPVFVSHSKRGHSKLTPMDTDTARMDLAGMVTTLIGSTESPITPHVLRHFAGNELRKATGDLEIVRILLGHESMDTTKGYMHVEDEEALETYQRTFSSK